MNTQEIKDPIFNIGSFGLHILKAPSGRFIFVGSIPVCLMIKGNGMFGEDYKSPSFETEQAAIDYFNDRKHLIEG